MAAKSSTSGLVVSAPGEMGARIREHDWARTSLGPSSQWPAALRCALDICIHSMLPTAIYWGPDLVLLYNDAWSVIPSDKHPWALGRPAREVWSDIWHIVGPQLARVIEHGEGVAVYDHLLPMMRGGIARETYWNYSFTPIRDETGRVLGIFNQGHETTEKFLAERVRESELVRFRALFEQAPSPVALLRGPQHVYAMANAAYLRLIGRRADVIGKPASEVIPEIIVEQGFGEVLDSVYRTGEAYVRTGARVIFRAEPGDAGQERVLDFIFQPVRNSNGKISGVLIQIIDVTERVRAEDDLRKLNEQLEALIAERTAALSQAVSALESLVQRMRTTLQTSFIYQGYLSPEGTVLESNAELLAGIDVTIEDVVGKPFWDAPWFTSTPGASNMVKHALAKVARGEGMRRRIELDLPGGRRTFDFSLRPVKDEHGRVIGIVPEAVDLTPLLQAEERLRQSQKMEAVGQLTGGIAHDFNNLLTGIMGALDMMQKRLAEQRYGKVDEYAKAVLASANRAAALTHRLLAFARRQPLDPRPVAANALIGGMEDMLRRTLGENIQLDVRATAGLWLTRCDANQLESALLNLVINARDAMPHGGRIIIETSNVEIGASDTVTLDSGEYVCIAVKDTGTGMPQSVIEKAIDPFFTTKPLGQGTGLGLSMAYGFVRQSGGDIAIASIVGEGTVVRLYLPRFVGEADRSVPDGADTGSYRLLGDRTALVVEDEVVVRQLVVDVLSDLGWHVLEAADGAQGLRVLLSDERIDLLITDVGLPQLGGRQMVNLARQERPKLRTLFITGYAETDTAVEVLAPREQLMLKPFAMETLAQRVRELMAGS